MLIARRGVAILEFEYLPRLLAGGQLARVYHERRFFFTLDAFARVCGESGGLTILAAEQVAAQGGSLRVVIGDGGTSAGVAALRESEASLRSRNAHAAAQ